MKMVGEMAAHLVPVKIRLRSDLKRRIERLAILSDRSLNAQITLLLESAVLAEQSGVGGIDGVIKAVQSKAASAAIEELYQRFLQLENQTMSKPDPQTARMK
jgi:hypothetical protein